MHRALFSIWMSEEFLAQNYRHVSDVTAVETGPEMTLQVNTLIDALFTLNESIVANKGNIDSYGSRYCNLEEAA